MLGEGTVRVVSREGNDRFVVGVDFGTLSGRALVVRVSDGAEMGTAVSEYEHGVMDRQLASTGADLPPDWALQDPQDWLEVLRTAVPKALSAAGVAPSAVIGIATDFTASTVLPTRADGTPLCFVGELSGLPHAYPKLWRHHAAQAQADRVNAVARERNEPWLAYYGGRISAEWQLAKGLQLLEEAPELYDQAERWIEAADWIIWQLCGRETRNACTAGYKGQFHAGQYPTAEYLAALHPSFATFVTDKIDFPLSPLGRRAGSLTAQAAAWTGLPEGIAVAVGNVDAHVTAPAAKATQPGQLLAVMGTSTCHVLNAERPAQVPGMCGIVDGGIIEGLWGLEAGQSGVGDIFGWWAQRMGGGSSAEAHLRLSELAAAQPVGAHGLVALDWQSGNRSVLVDHHLSGVIVGLTLATRPEDVYRALVESTAYGTRVIVEALEANGVPVNQFIASGGLIKNDFVMQIYADVLNRPIGVIGTDQGPALGSAIHAAVAAGAYPDVPAAAAVMGKRHDDAYLPRPSAAAMYDRLYAEYRLLHDYFGRGENEVLHRLRTIRDSATASASDAHPTHDH
jgi:L-ribulokinase